MPSDTESLMPTEAEVVRLYRRYNFRLYPNKEQQAQIELHFGAARFVFNWGLEQKLLSFETTGESLTDNELSIRLVHLKKENKWLADASAWSLQKSLKQLDQGFRAYLNGKHGRPGFRSRKSSRQSFTNCQTIKLNYTDGKLSVGKIRNIKAKLSRKISGAVKEATILRTSAGTYEASLLIEVIPQTTMPPVYDESTIGVDLGIKTYAHLSTGETHDVTRPLCRNFKKLWRARTKLYRRNRDSRNYNKQRKIVAKLHAKISNTRRDNLHKLSTKLLRENQAATFCFEDLAVTYLSKNRFMKKHISDAGWKIFLHNMWYKGQELGNNVIIVDRYLPSSKTCSDCGYRNDELTLKSRSWTCADCGITHDRDFNAALNIRAAAIADYRAGVARINACGVDCKSTSKQESRLPRNPNVSIVNTEHV